MHYFIDKTSSLTPNVRAVICDKATEAPYSGVYNAVAIHGTYSCRRCGLALFRADCQFSAGCGWPAFDDIITQSIKERPDEDGARTEIQCHRCSVCV